MALRVVWGITGSGDKLRETVAAMAAVAEEFDVEITAAASIAGDQVLRWYRLREAVDAIATSVKVEKHANLPFIAGALQIGEFDCLVVAPASANTVAKIVHGVADTMLTNAVGLTAKSETPSYIMPTDVRPGWVETELPDGERLKLRVRAVDAENVGRLREMEGISVFESPSEIEGILNGFRETQGR